MTTKGDVDLSTVKVALNGSVGPITHALLQSLKFVQAYCIYWEQYLCAGRYTFPLHHILHTCDKFCSWTADNHGWRIKLQLHPPQRPLWQVCIVTSSITRRCSGFLFSIVQTVSTPIDPHIYGVNFPTSPDYIEHLGVTISRWGGNAVTAYNPFGGFTNAGNDWYFENRDSDSADDWAGWVHGAGSDTLVTIPA